LIGCRQARRKKLVLSYSAYRKLRCVVGGSNEQLAYEIERAHHLQATHEVGPRVCFSM
jgi:hypothetical protein